MSATGFLRLKKLKGSGIIAAAARHNRRAIQTEVGANASIDPARSGLNETLHGPATADDVAQLAVKRLRSAGISKLRKNAVVGLEVVFSLPIGTLADDRSYFADCAAWATLNFGGQDNILTVDIHRDEAAPHCHVLILPMLNNRMVGSDMVGNRAKLLQMQQDFHRDVAARHGLRKAPARLVGATKQRAVAAVLGRLQAAADGAVTSVAWATIRDAIERDPAPFLAAMAIELEPPKKKLRTMTQIFTSKGKGKTTENPIGFAQVSKTETLSCVGVAQTFTAPPAPPVPAVSQFTREREHDLDPASYDPDTGEFRTTPARPAGVKAVAAAWVGAALAAKRAKP